MPFPPVRDLIRRRSLAFQSFHSVVTSNTLWVKSPLRASILGFSLAIVDITMNDGFAGCKQLFGATSMSENTTIEQRLTAVENELRNLKRKIESTDSWYDRMTGAFENDPAFEEVLKLGRQFRESQGQADEDD
jgi:hypothetical protein